MSDPSPIYIRITTDDLQTFDIGVSPDWYGLKKRRKAPLFTWNISRRVGLNVTTGIGTYCKKKYRSPHMALHDAIDMALKYAQEHPRYE